MRHALARWWALGAVSVSACGLADAGLVRPPVFDAGPVTFPDGALIQRESDGGPDGCGPCGNPCASTEVCVADACVPRSGAPPRLIAPASFGRLTSQRPTLRWLLPEGETGARAQVCRDRACEQVVQSADATGRSLRLPEALAPGVYFWRVFVKRGAAVAMTPSATWEFVVRARSADVDTNHGTLFDADGDGYGDVVVGSGAARRAAIYAGGPTGISLTPTTTLPSAADGSTSPFSNAGDLNGDGYHDMLAFETVGGERRVTLRPGGARGVTAAPVTLVASDPWPESLGSAGDVNGDGYGDLVGMDAGTSGPSGQVRVFFGTATGVRPRSAVMVPGDATTATGVVASGGADLNGDGRPDFVFGMSASDDGVGRAFVWINGGCGLGRIVPLPGDTTALAHFGDAVSLAGDLDGDGYADAVIAAPHDASEVDRSALWIYPGSAAGPVTANPRRIPFAGHQRESIRLLASGDLNGDGYGDLAAWMHTSLRPPEMSVFFGAPTGLPATPALRAGGADYEPGQSAFGMGFAGDTDRDGFDDMLVYLSPGRVVLSRGSPTGPFVGTSLPAFVLP